MMKTAETVAVDRRTIPGGASVDYWTAADGWKLRRLRWPASPPAKGTILFLGGRGDFFEKYLEALGHFQAQDWNVESVDWRGQGGSGRLAAQADVGHAHDFGDWTRDLADYIADLKARTDGPVVVMGHSMGGHLVMRTLAEHRSDIAAAVLIAPMMGFADVVPRPVGAGFARMMAQFVGREQKMWKASEKPFSPMEKRMGLLTHCEERYADESFWWDKNPDLVLGPASWGWISAAYDSFAWMAEKDRLEHVKTNTLILSATADQLVSPKATRAIAARIPNAKLVEYGDEAAHELLRESDEVRLRAFGEIDALLTDVISEH